MCTFWKELSNFDTQRKWGEGSNWGLRVFLLQYFPRQDMKIIALQLHKRENSRVAHLEGEARVPRQDMKTIAFQLHKHENSPVGDLEGGARGGPPLPFFAENLTFF